MIPSRLRFAWTLKVCACLAGTAWAGRAGAESIVFLGNSITQHGADPSIEWNVSWGMAASRADRDYASQVTAALKRTLRGGLTADIQSDYTLEHDFFRLSASEVDTLLKPVARARFVILQFGDNVDLSGGRNDGALFGLQYAVLLSGLKAHFGAGAKLVCIGKWWPAPAVDAEIEARCKAAGGRYVRISDLYAQPWGRAASERPFSVEGVGEHPGDRAMHEIALRVAAALAAGTHADTQGR